MMTLANNIRSAIQPKPFKAAFEKGVVHRLMDKLDDVRTGVISDFD
jgi:hypothetical protein